jgi:hypothetical protein
LSAGETVALYGGAAANLVVFALLSYQLLGGKRRGGAKASSLAEAFGGLTQALASSVPGLPAGFTIREGLAGARRLAVRVDWPKVEGALEAYEGFRFGGHEAAGVDYSEVVILAVQLKRGKGR